MEKKKKKEIKREVLIKQETDVWINQRTGEMLEATEILKPVGRQGFMITYLSEIIRLLDKLGNKKMIIVKHILTNMEPATNTYLTTTRELAQKTNTCLQTVTDTLKILEEANIIQRRLGAIMINPRLVHRGTDEKEKALLTRFYDFNNKTKKQD